MPAGPPGQRLRSTRRSSRSQTSPSISRSSDRRRRSLQRHRGPVSRARDCACVRPRARPARSSKAARRSRSRTDGASHNVPTAVLRQVQRLRRTRARHLDGSRVLSPSCIKADGLAAGKGVIGLQGSRTSALAALDEMMQEKRFGDAADTVVVEEFLRGRGGLRSCR